MLMEALKELFGVIYAFMEKKQYGEALECVMVARAYSVANDVAGDMNEQLKKWKLDSVFWKDFMQQKNVQLIECVKRNISRVV